MKIVGFVMFLYQISLVLFLVARSTIEKFNSWSYVAGALVGSLIMTLFVALHVYIARTKVK